MEKKKEQVMTRGRHLILILECPENSSYHLWTPFVYTSLAIAYIIIYIFQTENLEIWKDLR